VERVMQSKRKRIFFFWTKSKKWGKMGWIMVDE
jgi:hypothetical protein